MFVLLVSDRICRRRQCNQFETNRRRCA